MARSENKLENGRFFIVTTDLRVTRNVAGSLQGRSTFEEQRGRPPSLSTCSLPKEMMP